MNIYTTLWRWFHSRGQTRAVKEEIDEELRFHLEQRRAEGVAAGLAPEEADRAARKRFGNLQKVREECRDVRGAAYGETLWQDVRFAWRMLGKNPGFTAGVLLTLALGIGASAAIYSVVNTVILNPVPGPDPDRLVQIAERTYSTTDQQPFFCGVSPLVLRELRANPDFFADFAMYYGTRFESKTEGFTDQHAGELVSPNFFTLWQVPPALGRTFGPDEAVPLNDGDMPERDGVMVLSHSWWKSWFHGDPAVLGKTVRLSGHQFTVIGVMPPQFQFPDGRTLFWVPAEDLRFRPHAMEGPNIRVLARLKPDVSQPQAQARLDTLAQRLVKDQANTWGYPDEWRQRPGGLGFWIRPLRAAFQDGYGLDDFRRTLFGLLAAIGFVLLIVCANVANLTLARTERRQQELAVRAALGAGRGRLMRQLLTESVLLACLGGLGGLLVAGWGIRLLAMLVPANMPRLQSIQLDGHVLATALLVSVATGILFGVLPAWHAGQAALGETLKQTGSGATAGKGRRHNREALVVVQVALALVLLAGAGLMIESVVRLLHVKPGFDSQNLLRVTVNLPWDKYSYRDGNDQGEPRNLLLAGLRERLAALPGVQAVGIDKQNFPQKFKVDDSGLEVQPDVNGCGVDEGDLFKAMRVPLLSGRYLNKNDMAGGYFYDTYNKEGITAVVVNETMARLCWPGQDALGKTFRGAGRSARRIYQVAGVVADMRDFRYDQNVSPIVYRPYQEFDLAGLAPAFLLRTSVQPAALIPAIRRELIAAEPAMIAPDISVVRQTLYDATQARRTYTLYLVVFAGVGLLLSALGIYAVLAYSVAQRTREIGIRMAVGAEPRHVLGLVMKQGLRLAGIGAVTGLLAAFWLTRLLRHQLFAVSPNDPLVLIGATLVLFFTALLACYLPARRATKIDPLTALRYE